MLFFTSRVRFLGHVISNEGIHVDSDKVAIVKDWPAPRDKTELRRFWGFAAYYRRFVRNFAIVEAPLTKLSGKDDFIWSNESEDAFSALKAKLTETPVLKPFQKPDKTLASLYWIQMQVISLLAASCLRSSRDKKESLLMVATKDFIATKDLVSSLLYLKDFAVISYPKVPLQSLPS